MLNWMSGVTSSRGVAGQKATVLALDQSGALGGAELSLLEICKRSEGRFEVVLFTDGLFRERLSDAGVAVRVLQQPAFQAMRASGGESMSLKALVGGLKLIWNVAKLARSRRVVYANTQKAMVIGAFAGLIAGRPVVWHLRDIVSLEHFGKSRLFVIKWITKLFVSHVIANSEASASALRTLAKLHVGKISVVYNGIDSASFDVAATVPAAKLRARYQLPENAFLIGCFSRLAHWKGQHVLLQALESIPNAHGVIVGSALFGEDEYAQLLQLQADVPALRGRVHFLGFQADVASLMVAMDVVVHTSIAPEPFGRVIVEAMLARRPIVASRAGGALEIITHAVDGLLVEPDNSAALASAINNLRATPDLNKAIVSQGYIRAKDFFGPVAYCMSVMGKLEKIGGIKVSTVPVLASVARPPFER